MSPQERPAVHVDELPRAVWAVRTARAFPRLLGEEIAGGRLRQGWGWMEEQDLRVIAAARDAEGHGALSTAQRVTWKGNQRLLTDRAGSVRAGDWIVTPHLPEAGKLAVWRVAGEYVWDPLETPQHPEGFARDFGHVLPVEPVARGIDPAGQSVSVGLRRSLRAQGRMFSLDRFADELVELARGAERGDARITERGTTDQQLALVRDRVVDAVFDGIQRHIDNTEFERLVERALERNYPGATTRTAGPKERGADVLVRHESGPFGLPEQLVVQVKHWESSQGSGGLGHLRTQLETALTAYPGSTGAIGVTLLEDEDVDPSAPGMQTFADLEESAGVPVRILGRSETLELVMPVILETAT